VHAPRPTLDDAHQSIRRKHTRAEFQLWPVQNRSTKAQPDRPLPRQLERHRLAPGRTRIDLTQVLFLARSHEEHDPHETARIPVRPDEARQHEVPFQIAPVLDDADPQTRGQQRSATAALHALRQERKAPRRPGVEVPRRRQIRLHRMRVRGPRPFDDELELGKRRVGLRRREGNDPAALPAHGAICEGLHDEVLTRPWLGVHESHQALAHQHRRSR
jgi:hypothetical protein